MLSFDPDGTRLQYNQARYYDLVSRRWISQDPEGFRAGDANLYRYVGNSPTNFKDPSGRLTGWAAAGVGAAIGATLNTVIYVGIEAATGNWNNITLGGIGGAAASGAVAGAMFGAFAGALTGDITALAVLGAQSGFLAGISGSLVQQSIDTSDINSRDVLFSAVAGTVGGAIGGGMFGAYGATLRGVVGGGALAGGASGAIGGGYGGAVQAGQQGGDVLQGLLWGAAKGTLKGAIGGAAAGGLVLGGIKGYQIYQTAGNLGGFGGQGAGDYATWLADDAMMVSPRAAARRVAVEELNTNVYKSTVSGAQGTGEMVSQYIPMHQRLYVSAIETNPQRAGIGTELYRSTIGKLMAEGKPITSIAGEMANVNWRVFQTTGDVRSMPSIKIREGLGFTNHEWQGPPGPGQMILSTKP